MGLREQRRAETRAAITDAARDLLEERGMEGLTFRAIAERAGVSVGTVVNHGGSKAKLVVGLLVDDLTAAMDAHAADSVSEPTDPVDAALLRFRRFFELYAARPSLARRVILEAAFAPDDAFEPYLAVTVRFVLELSAWLAECGCLRDNVSPLVAARVLFDTYIGVVVLFLREEEPRVEDGMLALRVSMEQLRPVLFADGGPDGD